jgi:hypothetical protein
MHGCGRQERGREGGGTNVKKPEEDVTGSEAKKEYEPPEVRSEEVFETLAVACTKAVVGACTAPPGGATLRS